MTQVAVFDAVNAITGGYEGYVLHRHGPKDASAPAAVAQAAHDVLTAVFPAQAATLRREARVLAGGPKRSRREQGRGARPRQRAGDPQGAKGRWFDRAGAVHGRLRPRRLAADPAGVQPQPGAAAVAGRQSPSACRRATPSARPARRLWASAAYTAAFNEVKSLGAVTARRGRPTRRRSPSSGPTAPAPRPRRGTGTRSRRTSARRGTTRSRRTPACSRCWTWRWPTPASAAGTASTSSTSGVRSPRSAPPTRTATRPLRADPSWTPLLVTPNFPTYVSGHSTFSAAAATVLADFFGTDHVHFATSDDTLPGVTRSFDSFSAAAAEAGQSRVYGGIHYQFDNQDGLALGRKVGSYVFSHVLVAEQHGGHGKDIALSSDKHEVTADKRASNAARRGPGAEGVDGMTAAVGALERAASVSEWNPARQRLPDGRGSFEMWLNSSAPSPAPAARRRPRCGGRSGRPSRRRSCRPPAASGRCPPSCPTAS